MTGLATTSDSLTTGLLIACKDAEVRERIAETFSADGYNVIVTDSAAGALEGILKRTAEVVLLGSEFDQWSAGELVPVLKKCNPELTIILIAEEASLGLLRKLRREGIFYHALRPRSPQDCDELRQAVECALDSVTSRRAARRTREGGFHRPEMRRVP